MVATVLRRGDAPREADAEQGTLVEHCYRILKHDIIRGTRPPGERLRIDKLRTLYGVGTSPIREALQRLTGDGLVLVRERRGFQVAPIDMAEFADLNLARTEIELAILRLAIEHGDDEWEAGIVAAAYRLEKGDALLHQLGDAAFDEWNELNRAFHSALLAACPSRWLLRTRDALNEKCERYRRFSVSRDRTERNLLQEHRDIADAVIKRDQRSAAEKLREHYARTASGLEKIFAE